VNRAAAAAVGGNANAGGQDCECCAEPAAEISYQPSDPGPPVRVGGRYYGEKHSGNAGDPGGCPPGSPGRQ
jgi:hypothetical protein